MFLLNGKSLIRWSRFHFNILLIFAFDFNSSILSLFHIWFGLTSLINFMRLSPKNYCKN